jgi:O-antigen ligase
MNKSVLSMLLAGGMFFLLPFFCNPYASPELQLEPPKLIAVFLLGAVIFGIYLSRRIHWLIGAMFVVFAINSWISGFGSMQMYGMAYLSSAIFISLWFVELKEYQKRVIFTAIVLSGVGTGIFAILQLFNMDPIFHYAPGIDSTLPIGLLGQTTKYGAFMAICFGIAVAYDFWLLSLFIGIMALTSMSSMTFAAMLAVLIVRSRRMKYGTSISRYLVLIPGGVLLFGFFLRPEANVFFSHGRTEIWMATIKAWWNGRRLFGFGPGSFDVLFASNWQPESTHGIGIFNRAHNDYIQLIFEFGIPGILLIVGLIVCLLAYYWTFLKYPRKAKKSQIAAECAFTAIAVNALANFPFQLAPHYLIGMMSLCILLKSLKKDGTLKI